MPGLKEKSVSRDAVLGSWNPTPMLRSPRRNTTNAEVFGPEALPQGPGLPRPHLSEPLCRASSSKMARARCWSCRGMLPGPLLPGVPWTSLK